MKRWTPRKGRYQSLSDIENSSQPYHRQRGASSLAGLAGTAGLLLAETAIGGEGIELRAGGELRFGVLTAEEELLSDGEGDRGYTFFGDSELFIEAEIMPSEDWQVGAEIVLEADADQLDEPNADETYIYLTNGFGLMQLGRTEGAEDEMALGADTIAAGTGGIDGDTENLGDVQVRTSEDAAKISYYSPRIGSFQLGVSFTPDTGDDETGSDRDEGDLENHLGVGLNLLRSFGATEIGVAAVGSFGRNEAGADGDLSAFQFGGTMTLGEAALGASYGQVDDETDFDFATLGITVGVGEAEAGVGYNYVDEKRGPITQVVALSVDFLLLEGAEVQGDISYADPEDERTSIASVLALALSF